MKGISAMRRAGWALMFFLIVTALGGIDFPETASAQDRVLTPPPGRQGQIRYSIKGKQEMLTPGTAVSRLPTGCTKVYKREATYFSCGDGIYFKPHYMGSDLVYLVVEKP